MKTDDDIGVPSTSSSLRNLIHCSYCQFSYESKSAVIEHILNDHRETDFSWKCNICIGNVCTKHRSTFKRHLQFHFDLKPFSCKFCMYSASLKSDIKKRVKRKHPNGGTDTHLVSQREENNDKLKLQILPSRNTHVASSNYKIPHIDKNIDIENKPKSILKQKKSVPFHENKCNFSEKHNVILPSSFSYPSKTNSTNTMLNPGNSTNTKFKYGFHSETPAIERDLCALECSNYVSNKCDEMQKNITDRSFVSTTSTYNIVAQNKTSCTETLSSSKSSFHTDTGTSIHIRPESGTSSSELIIERACSERPLDLSVTRPNCKTKIQKQSILQKKNI